MMKKLKIIVYDPQKNKKIQAGILIDGMFIKEVSSRHFMKVEQGYGIQEEAIQILTEKKCITVLINTPTDTYEIPFSEYLKATPKNYSHGLQRFVSIKNEHFLIKDSVCSSQTQLLEI